LSPLSERPLYLRLKNSKYETFFVEMDLSCPSRKSGTGKCVKGLIKY
jgi:hypothetical protein